MKPRDLGDAAWDGDLEEARSMIRSNPSQVHDRDSDGRGPLHYAALYGHVEIAELLLDLGAEIDEKDRFGCTPLMVGTHEEILVEDHTPVTRLLCSRGADVNCRDNDGHTALHWAIMLALDDEIVPLLLEYGADVNAVGRNGNTPLHEAAAGQSIRYVRLLLEQPGIRTDLRNHDGLTPRELAVQKGALDVAALLEEFERQGGTRLVSDV